MQTLELPTSQPVPLRRNRNFQLLWTGSAAALLGLFVAEIAFPLVILSLTGSPGLTSLFAAVQTGAAVLLGIPAGRLLDIKDRRAILIFAELARAAAAATVVTAFWLDQVGLAHLLVVAAVLGAAQPFGAARILLIRTAVPAEQLTPAVTAEEVRNNAAELSGPPLGGLLYGIAPVLPFVFAVVMFVASTVTACFVRVPSITRDAAGSAGGMFAGLAAVLREPTMRAVVMMIILVNGVAYAAQLIVIVLLRDGGTPPWQIGLALSGFAVGGLAGTALIPRLYGRLRPGVLLMTLVLFEVPVLLALAVPFGPWWVGLACLCFGLGVPAVRVLIDVLIIRQIPDEQRGRALGGVITLFTLSVPLGMIVTGALLEVVSPSATLVALATTLLLGVAYAASRPTLRHANWPAAR